jgi:meso-butanediol dehydrogenase/(S,S)-butanediol dehydrogenase/diacetyl reductase
MRMEGKVALVTGGGSGIGEATVRTLAREGAHVVIADVETENAERIVQSIQEAGGQAAFIQTDILSLPDLERMVAFAASTYGRLDVLHNHAMVTSPGRIGAISVGEWQRALDGGLTAYWYASKLAVEVMREQRSGAIVNTSSMCGLAGDYGMGTYNVAKAGILNLTRAFALDYARVGIRCNAVCPGPIMARGVSRAVEARPDVHERIRERVPLGRYGVPQEIANVMLFLASDESAYVTGAYIVADGGFCAHTGMASLSGEGPDWGD